MGKKKKRNSRFLWPANNCFNKIQRPLPITGTTLCVHSNGRVIIYHMFIQVDIAACRGLFPFCSHGESLNYVSLFNLWKWRNRTPRGSTSCPKQAHLNIISTSDPHFLVRKVLSFPPRQAAYLVAAWNCNYQLHDISTEWMIMNIMHATRALCSHPEGTLHFGISEELFLLALFRKIMSVHFW